MLKINESSLPDAAITVNKSRLRIYDKESKNTTEKGNVYLKDGQKFEIELRNPYTTEQVLCKVSINGVSLNDEGLVLDKGRGVYLERFFEEDKAFIFKSLKLGDAEKESLGNILKHAGNVKITFHKFVSNPIHDVIYISWPRRRYYWDYDWWYGYGTLCNKTNDLVDRSDYDGGWTKQNLAGQGFYGASLGMTNMAANNDSKSIGVNMSCNSSTLSSQNMLSMKASNELGIVGEGEKTGQELDNAYVYDGKFDATPCKTFEFHLMAADNRPIEAKEIRRYCTHCQRKLSPSWRFCSSCGTPAND